MRSCITLGCRFRYWYCWWRWCTRKRPAGSHLRRNDPHPHLRWGPRSLWPHRRHHPHSVSINSQIHIIIVLTLTTRDGWEAELHSKHFGDRRPGLPVTLFHVDQLHRVEMQERYSWFPQIIALIYPILVKRKSLRRVCLHIPFSVFFI